MDDRPRRTADEILRECLAEPPERRSAFLESACRGDPALRAEMESLLAAHAEETRDPRGPLDPLAAKSFVPPENSGAGPGEDRGAEGDGRAIRGKRIGAYTIVREIGRGGFGVVYEAEQLHPKRAVALKVMRRERDFDDLQAKLFQRETQALARLRHPAIASIYEAGTTGDGERYFAMELVRGRTLTDYVRDSLPGESERLDLFRTICDAIHYAHQRGVMHRDLKPGNILIEPGGAPKILDFGLAKITDADLALATLVTEVGRIQGTLAYMSPEQARGDADAIDLRTDIYSLGVILYEMLTGALPYDVSRSALHEAVRAICEEEPRRPSVYSRALRGDLETIVLKAIAKEPARRYPSAAALGDDLHRYLTNQPIAARPPSTAYQLRKLVARHKAPFVSAAALFVLLAGFGVWMSVLYAQAERLRRASEEAEAAAKARAEELEIVTDFQASMLSGIDAEEMGRALYGNIAERVEESLEKEGTARSDRRRALELFDRNLRRTNATDVALDLIDEEVLGRAARTIETEFAGRPLIRAALQQTVATVYREIGRYAQALPLQEAALETRRRELSDDHARTLASATEMGHLRWAMGDLDQASRFFGEALAGYERTLGEDHPETLGAKNNMGVFLYSSGKLDEGEAHYREALAGRRRVLGDDHPETLGTMNNLGVLLKAKGKLDEALALYRAALDGRRRVLGDDHAETLQSLDNMSVLLKSMNRPDEAATHGEEAVAGYRRVLGDDHPNTLNAINNMGMLLQSIGRPEEAGAYLSEALEGRRRVLGDDHPRTLTSVHTMGMLLESKGETGAALDHYRKAFDGRRRVLGDDHQETLVSVYYLGRLLLAEGRAEEALGVLEPAEQATRSALTGARARGLGRFLVVLGKARTAAGRFEAARASLAEAESIFREASSATGTDRDETVMAFVALYEAWNAAEPNRGHDRSATEWKEKLAAR